MISGNAVPDRDAARSTRFTAALPPPGRECSASTHAMCGNSLSCVLLAASRAFPMHFIIYSFLSNTIAVDRHSSKKNQIETAFPSDFLWGASACAHQVEGGNYQSDWWRWEQRPGRIAGGATSADSAGHFTRFENDFALAKRLGLNAHLFNVEWARVEPEPNQYNEDALAHYAAVAETLVRVGIAPICGLVWGTLPKWLGDAGGWTAPGMVGRFQQYARRVVDRLGPHCGWWIPVIEPMWSLRKGYLEGAWPPEKAGVFGARSALHNIFNAHAAAYEAIHERVPHAMVGSALRVKSVEPADEDSPWDLHAARWEAWLHPKVLLDALVRGQLPLGRTSGGGDSLVDFIGISFFGKERARFQLRKVARLVLGGTAHDDPHADEERIPDPDRLLANLKEFGAYGKPLLVTGSGAATTEDAIRCRHIRDDVRVLEEAIHAGLDVCGYIHHTLMDGFTWAHGYRQRWGLIHVDFETLARTPNPSAYFLREIIQAGAIPPGADRRFCKETQELAP